MIFNNC